MIVSEGRFTREENLNYRERITVKNFPVSRIEKE